MFLTVEVSWFNLILNGKAVDLCKVYGLFPLYELVFVF